MIGKCRAPLHLRPNSEQVEKNLPGIVIAPSLTPELETGAAIWTDDQFARAIREGIGHDGRTLFPLMPYLEYRAVSDAWPSPYSIERIAFILLHVKLG